MRPFNIDIFGRDFAFKHHHNIGDIKYAFDYLSIAESSATVSFNADVKTGDYINISNGEREYFGIITGIDAGGNVTGFSTVRYKPFLHLFDAPIMFDTTLQPGSAQGTPIALEEVIADYIRSYWIENADVEQNIDGLRVQTISSTTDWGFHLTADVEGTNRCIINFMTAIIQRAMTKYQIGVYITPNINEKTITVQIGRKAFTPMIIEADLPSVITRKVVLNETQIDVNKLIIYNNEDLIENTIYYKHTDGSYDTTDNDRMKPVIFNIVGVAVNQESTFAEAAKIAADKALDTVSYNNLIEVTVFGNDALIPLEADDIGMTVDVKTNGAIYPSVLTGIEIDKSKKLIFGTVRIELTKILKGARNG